MIIMNELLKNKKLLKEIMLYCIIGGTSSIIDSVVYYILTRSVTFDEFLSNFISVNIGITISFLLNTFINFKKSDKLFKRAVSFYTVGYFGLGLSMLILYIGVHSLEMNDMIVKLGSIFIVAAFQFVLNKLVTYGKIK